MLNQLRENAKDKKQLIYNIILGVLLLSVVLIVFLLPLIKAITVSEVWKKTTFTPGYEIDTVDYEQDGVEDYVAVCYGSTMVQIYNSAGTNVKNSSAIAIGSTVPVCAMKAFKNSTNTRKKNLYVAGVNNVYVLDAVTGAILCTSAFDNTINAGHGQSRLIDYYEDGTPSEFAFINTNLKIYNQTCGVVVNKKVGASIREFNADIGDLDGDGNTNEIAFLNQTASTAGYIRDLIVLNSVGAVQWSKPITSMTTGRYLGLEVENITDDAGDEVIALYSASSPAGTNLTVFDRSGNILFSYLTSTKNFLSGDVITGDFDNDNVEDDIVAVQGSSYGAYALIINVTAFTNTGTKLWQTSTGVYAEATDVAYGDINNDGEKEIVIGTNNVTQNVLILDSAGNYLLDFVLGSGGGSIGNEYTSMSSILLSDLNGNSIKEIIMSVENVGLDVYEVDGAPPADDEYPQFSGYWDDNASIEGTGNAHFNVTLLSTNGTVILNLNGTNYTASNSSGDIAVFNVTVGVTHSGLYIYNWSSYGNGTSSLFNISDTRKYTVNTSIIVDNEYPQFSSYWDNNGSIVASGVGYFNVTLLNTNGTVILNFDGTNYTASNKSGDITVFNVTISSITTGKYPYNWSSYGNGTLHNYNVSNSRSYTVNGSVCVDLNTANSVYTLTNNITSTVTCFLIGANNITLDCDGYVVDGNDGSADYGIDNSGSYSNLTIKDCWFTDWDRGIWSNGNYLSLLNVNSSSNRGNGMRFDDSKGYNLTSVKTIDNGEYDTSAGIYINNVNESYFYDIESSGNSNPGIDMTGASTSNTFKNVYTHNNEDYGIVCELNSQDNYYENINSSNNRAGIIVNIGANNTVIINATTNNNSQLGIAILLSANVTVKNSTANKNYNAGIYLVNVSGLSFDNVGSRLNILEGFWLSQSNYSTFFNITSNDNGNNGFLVVGSDGNNITNATLIDNIDGFWLQNITATPAKTSDNNNFVNVYASGNDHGFYITSGIGNILTNSTIVDSITYGVQLASAGISNKIYNNILNNTNNVGITGRISVNYFNTTQQDGTRIFSNGTQIGGNYWTNSSKTGYSDTCDDTNVNGFCDSSYDAVNKTATCTSTVCDYLPYSNDYFPNTCTYSGSGEWDVECDDNCSVTSDVTGDGSNLVLSGDGVFTLNANVSGFLDYFIVKGCNVTSRGGVFVL